MKLDALSSNEKDDDVNNSLIMQGLITLPEGNTPTPLQVAQKPKNPKTVGMHTTPVSFASGRSDAVRMHTQMQNQHGHPSALAYQRPPYILVRFALLR
jgi:hypothetical protein